jgi:GNAT superfamily N-acetyltransferase
LKIKIREIQANDVNFVLSTWIKSSYSNLTGYREKQSVYHKGLEALIKKKYNEGKLIALVACLEEDESILLGFATFNIDYSLNYIYVKEAFKRVGIAKQILKFMYKNRKEIVVTFWTKDISIIKKMYSVTYDRFKFFN